MTTLKSYRDLRVWQGAVSLSVQIYKVTEKLPKSEIYGITSQMRRSSVSIASNIAEGFGRTDIEFNRFLRIAIGSLAELETQIEIAFRVSYLTVEEYEMLNDLTNALGRQINALIRSIQQTTSGSINQRLTADD